MTEYIKISQRVYDRLRYREQVYMSLLSNLLNGYPKPRKVPENLTDPTISAYLRGLNAGYIEGRQFIQKRISRYADTTRGQMASEGQDRPEDTWLSCESKGGTISIESYRSEQED